MRRISR
jgi:hypothetical protein